MLNTSYTEFGRGNGSGFTGFVPGEYFGLVIVANRR
jgi:hypothetical protein